ncbi:hypothetical protein PSCLAVI8L_140115 [Pseudoclavibacter sp. 8L]|nr:hypothetical protein PSCLAVI8L_140115 [Pseudoclavibacter sp. 8L]
MQYPAPAGRSRRWTHGTSCSWYRGCGGCRLRGGDCSRRPQGWVRAAPHALRVQHSSAAALVATLIAAVSAALNAVLRSLD